MERPSLPRTSQPVGSLHSIQNCSQSSISKRLMEGISAWVKRTRQTSRCPATLRSLFPTHNRELQRLPIQQVNAVGGRQHLNITTAPPCLERLHMHFPRWRHSLDLRTPRPPLGYRPHSNLRSFPKPHAWQLPDPPDPLRQMCHRTARHSHR